MRARGTKLADRVNPNRLGAMLRLYRTVDNRTIRDVAKEIGTSPATLMRIEHGEAFDVATLLRLLHWFMSESKAPAPDGGA